MPRRFIAVGGYALATATQAAVGLLSVPLLTRLLGATQFGMWVRFEPLSAMLAQVGLVGANLGLLKLVGEDHWAPKAAWVRLASPALAGVAGMAVMAALGCLLIGAVPGGAIPLGLLVLTEGTTLLALAALRASNHSLQFASVLVLKAAALLLMLWCASAFGLPALGSAESLLWWALLPSVLACALACIWVLRQTRSEPPEGYDRLEGTPYRRAIRYGLPLMGAGLMSAVIAIGDRYVLALWLEVSAIGAYVVVVKMAGALNFLAMPLNMWFPAARFAHMRDADGGHRFFRRCALAVSLLVAISAGALWLVGPALVRWLSPAQAYSPVIAALLLCGAAATALVAVMNVGLLSSGHTHWPLLCNAAGGALQMALLLALVPRIGSAGAAGATCAACVVGLGLQNLLSQRRYRVPFAYKGMAGYALLVMCLCGGIASAFEHWAVRLCVYAPVALLAAGMLLARERAPRRA